LKATPVLFRGALAALTVTALACGCSKERIVESTEYVEKVEYVQLPGDTVLEIRTVYDTVRVTDTVQLVDTVNTQTGSGANAPLAIAALQYHTDPLVLEFAEAEFGLTDGWIFYLSSLQLAAESPSPGVFDLFGYIDFWAPDWSGYYPLEFGWRLTYKGGDAANPANWTQTEPPSAVAGHSPGLRRITEVKRATPGLR